VKKSYFVIIIILLALLVLSQFIPVFFKDKDENFVLPKIDDEINLYNESAYVIKDNFVDSIVINGYVRSYNFPDISIENFSSKNLDINIGDYLYEGNSLLIDYNLEGDYRITNVVYDNLQDVLNVTLIDLRVLRLELYISQENIGQVYSGQRIKYIFNKQEFISEISLIEPEIIEGMVKVFGVMVERPSVIFNGSLVEVEIITRQKENVLLVNKKAIYFINQQSYVDLITYNDNKEEIIRTKVVLGLDNSIYYEILSGIKEGQRVAVYYDEALIDEFN
jgi:hypothetical protein